MATKEKDLETTLVDQEQPVLEDQKEDQVKKVKKSGKKKFFWVGFVVLIAVLAIPEVHQKIMEKVKGKRLETLSTLVVEKIEPRLQQLENERAFEKADEVIASVEPVEETPADDSTAEAQYFENTVMSLEIQVLKKRLQGVEEALLQIQQVTQSFVTSESDFKKQVEDNSNQIQQIEKNKADASLVLELIARLNSTEQKLKQSAIEKEKTAALLLALYQLREAINVGQGFVTEQQTVLALANYNPRIIEALQRLNFVAETGVWTKSALEQTFDEYADKAILSTQMETPTHWWNKAFNALRGLVIIRRIDVSAEDTSIDAVLVRAGDAVENGDIQTAVIYLKGLAPEPLKMMQDWIVAAERYVLTQKTISEIVSNVLGVLYAEKLKGG